MSAERLFVAAELPVRVAEELAWWARDTCGSDPALRLLPVASLHLTLAFLGSRPEGDAERVAAALGAASFSWPVDLGWDDALWLPQRRPSVLAVGLDDPAGALEPLRSAVVAAVAAAIDWEPEGRPFLAHVSAARVRPGARPRTLELPLPSPERFPLAAVTLLRSVTSAAGADYTSLARVTAQS